MRPEYFWIIDFYIDDPQEDGKQARHIGVRYFVHNAGLADDGEFENEIREDPISDPWDFEW